MHKYGYKLKRIIDENLCDIVTVVVIFYVIMTFLAVVVMVTRTV